MVNIQTLDHHAYFRCARDSPGQESRVLDNPHFRSSLAGLTHYTKVLRLFFCKKGDSPIPPVVLPIASKVFHVEHCVSCEQVRLGSRQYFNQLPLAMHREVLCRVNEWLAHNDVDLVGAETVKLTTSHTKSSYSANETHFQSCGQGSAFSLYALRLYVRCSSIVHQATDFCPEPKTIRLTESNCTIL
ncbi:hypothetical protein CAPTEDRAFT_222077 [Capitella teleta]|uniref:Uncharacterized protein n=1 Tax=Capitella teleta TaxID=283909 RepID=R7V7F5_CAPTE|nr:hypothetical protein CAPTEDRAFT_222077 [Capitella teleta]|eukprot:ELU14407.1 hypothetical protein CAPTEDRAFT_222077 [Capitella teleta]